MLNKTINKLKKYKKLKYTLIIVAAIFIIIFAAEELIEPQGYVKPDYVQKDITQILSKDSFTEEDYKTLFYQTGLGKPAVDEILKNKESGTKEILNFQKNFFEDKNVLCEKIGIITSQESLVNENDKYEYGFDLAPYENGYVLITKATHSLGWRHGHAAIVSDKNSETTIEAVILGENTQIQNINKWRGYPSFMMLKLKDSSQETLDKIAQFANQNTYDLPYGLFVGLLSSKNPNSPDLTSTQCSHLVWYPFKQFGYDIDSDGSWLVTPKDIANSDLFEIVQIYGVDPEEIWP